ncbi:MAG: hypothetical protein AAFY29_22070 [Pseudomonadota bacterium]
MLSALRIRLLIFANLVLSPAVLAENWRQHTINDEFGFEQPMQAYAVELPEDWTLKGAVQWYGEAACQIDSNKVHFMATSPDGLERIEFIPGGSWGWMSLYDAMPQMRQPSIGGCAARRIVDPQGFVNAYLPSIRPDAEIRGSRSRPDLAQQIRDAAGPALNAPGQQVDIYVVELEISYEADGKRVNEILIPSMMFATMAGPDPYGGMNGVTLTAQALGTISTATVDGPVNEARMHRVAESMTMLPAYEQLLRRYYQQRTQMMAAALQRRRAAQQQYLAARRAAAAASAPAASAGSSGSDVLDIQFEGWKKRDAMTSAGQSRSVDGIYERQAYSNTSGQTVYMPSAYSRSYQLPNDVYVGTNDTFFNPVQSTGQFGDELQRYNYE